MEVGKVYTVGSEELYDEDLAKNRNVRKVGRKPNYPGGFAVKSPEDARRLIDEQNRVGDWAVYELDAAWGVDTVQSENGWWHALLNDSLIIGKVAPDDTKRPDLQI